jgi:hypothetical protein
MTSPITKHSRDTKGWDSIAVQATPSYIPTPLLCINDTQFKTLDTKTIQKMRKLLMANNPQSNFDKEKVLKKENELISKEGWNATTFKKIKKLWRECALESERCELAKLCGNQLSEKELIELQNWRCRTNSFLLIDLTKVPTDCMMFDLACAIMDKAETTIQIFAQQLLLFYDYGSYSFELSDTVSQIGSGKKNEKEKTNNTSCFQGAHYATITSLKLFDKQSSRELTITEVTPVQCDHTSSKPEECVRCNSKDVSKLWNSTALFPLEVNQVDSFIDGNNRVKNDDIKLRQRALMILNRVARTDFPDTPDMGLTLFVDHYLLLITNAFKHYNTKAKEYDIQHHLFTLMCYKKTAQTYKDALEQDREDFMRKICFRAGKTDQVQSINQTLNQAFYTHVKNEITKQFSLKFEEKSVIRPEQDFDSYVLPPLIPKAYKSTTVASSRYYKLAMKSPDIEKVAKVFFEAQKQNEATRMMDLKQRIDIAIADKILNKDLYNLILECIKKEDLVKSMKKKAELAKSMKEKEESSKQEKVRKSFRNPQEITSNVIETLWPRFEKESVQSQQLAKTLQMQMHSNPPTLCVVSPLAQGTKEANSKPQGSAPLSSLPLKLVIQKLPETPNQSVLKPSAMTTPVATPAPLSIHESQLKAGGIAKVLNFSYESPAPISTPAPLFLTTPVATPAPLSTNESHLKAGGIAKVLTFSSDSPAPITTPAAFILTIPNLNIEAPVKAQSKPKKRGDLNSYKKACLDNTSIVSHVKEHLQGKRTLPQLEEEMTIFLKQKFEKKRINIINQVAKEVIKEQRSPLL